MTPIQLRLFPMRSALIHVPNTITRRRRPFTARRRPRRVTRAEMRELHVLIAAVWNRTAAGECEGRRCADGIAMTMLWGGGDAE